ncbi:MAG TPA: LptA/OstA family protein [Candidatus Baltobacteraceae bacterium]|nr:LptA/OstA family protein [Candidatus Baltobacteraceae bacterium]
MKKPLAALALIVALVAAAPPKHAPAKTAAPAPSPVASGSPQPWTLLTDQMNTNMASGAFSAPDHVKMTRTDGSNIEADRANGNFKQHQASLFGHVIVHDASGTFGLKSAQGTQAQSRGPATLTADELHVDDQTHLYDASGSVHFEQGDTTVDSQTAHLNDATHVLTLTGKVHIVTGDRTLDSDSATYNTQSGSGEADNNVTIMFKGITPSIATPKPINIKAPKIP